ncbi:MAG: hypothetical protein R3F48_13530 [Candidatus Zixiibacteriota bacterium]
MKSEMIKVNASDFEKLKRDVELLKEAVFDDECELTEWAEKALEEARNTPRDECLSHEEVKRIILCK